jgi:hypothetical protein
MFKSTSYSVLVPDLPESLTYNCTQCHASASPSDYKLIKSHTNSLGLVRQIEQLYKCEGCPKFIKVKGNLSSYSLYHFISQYV